MSIVYGCDFIGRKTRSSNVLFIDQDTAETDLDRRLLSFARAMTQESRHRLYVESYQGYSIANSSLISTIDKYNAPIVIIDCLHSVCEGLDTNQTRDMAKLSKLKQEVLSEGRTLIIVHHESQKGNINVEEMMTMENIGSLSMGSSVIVQQADTLFMFGSKSKSKLKELYIRPVQKRVPLDIEPFIVELKENEKKNAMKFVMKGFFKDRPVPMYDIDKDIFVLFTEKPKLRTTLQIYYDFEGRYGIQAVRASLKRMVDNGRLIEHKKNPKLFEYEIMKKR